MQRVFSLRRFAVAGITASLLLTACQESEVFSKPLLARAESALLGEPPVISDAWVYEAEAEPQYAWRVPASNIGGWSINATNRQLARAFYNSVYNASLNTPIGWTGSHASCNAGTTSSDFKNSVLARINYFRAMAGVPANVTLDSSYNAKAQQAALMMSANNTLSHTPPASWNCYTADGRTAAESSNISLGHNGWDAVGGQMRDNGANNTVVGHRRWLLLPQTQRMGTGDVPASGSFKPANAVWVFDGNTYAARPTTRDEFVAWPTKGFNPYQVVPVRWSFSYPSANFTNATVTMTQGSSNVPLTQEAVANGYGENTIVWRPFNLSADQNWAKPSGDTTYQVTISNVVIGGQTRSFSYPVTVIDPQTAGTAEESPQVSGSSSPAVGVPATYSFTPVSFAQQHEAYVAEIAPATGSYNAEPNSLGVVDGTDSTYTLSYSGTGSNGTTVYRLAHPTVYATLETVEFVGTYIPSANSVLSFDSKLGFATPEQTAALQISLDDGTSWQDVYSKVGADGLTESAFSTKTVSLAAYANKAIKLRAAYRYAGSGYIYTGTSANTSFLVDNVQVSNAKRVVTNSVQNTGSNSSFTFTPIAGKQYALAARAIPWAGYPGLDWGALFFAEASATSDVDTIPDAFSFAVQTNVARSSEITSNAITVSGINTAAAISVTGGSYSINGGAFTTTPGLVTNGASVRVRHTSSANYATAVNTTLTIGGVSAVFSSNTLAEPAPMLFTERLDVRPATVIESNVVTVSGLAAPVSLAVTKGEYRKNGGAYTTAVGVVQNGDTLQVRHTSSARSKTAITTTLKLGKQVLTFKSTTVLFDTTPDTFSFAAKTGVAKGVVVESESVIITGINVPVAVSVSGAGGAYSVNGAPYVSKAGTVQAGDTIKVRQTSSTSGNRTVTTTLKVGTFSTTLKSTTQP